VGQAHERRFPHPCLARHSHHPTHSAGRIRDRRAEPVKGGAALE
jgi:hypothetical protein